MRLCTIFSIYDITLSVGFFQNDDNQVNIGDPIEDIMISEYHTIHHTMYMRQESLAKLTPGKRAAAVCVRSLVFAISPLFDAP